MKEGENPNLLVLEGDADLALLSTTPKKEEDISRRRRSKEENKQHTDCDWMLTSLSLPRENGETLKARYAVWDIG